MLNSIMDPLAKIKNVFNPQPNPIEGGGMGDPQETAIDPSLLQGQGQSQISSPEMHTPEHAAYDKLMEMLNNVPHREKPSLFRRIVAIGASLSGDPNKVRGVIDAPYNQKMGEFQDRFEPIYKTAQLENSLNVANSRERDRNDDNSRLWTALSSRTDLGNRNANIKQEQVDINKAREARQAKLDAGGTIYINKKDGKVYLNRRDGVLEDLDMTDLTEQEKDQYKTQGKLKEIDAQGDIRKAINDADNAAAKERNDADNATSRANNTASNTTRQSIANSKHDPGFKAMNETQKKQYVMNRADAYLRANPQAKDWIKIQDGRVTFTPPRTGGFFGMDPEAWAEEYDKARTYIDPEYGGPTGATPGDNKGSVTVGDTTPKEAPKVAPKAQVIPPVGKIKVKRTNPDTGKEEVGFIPLTQWSSAEKKGYKKVID